MALGLSNFWARWCERLRSLKKHSRTVPTVNAAIAHLAAPSRWHTQPTCEHATVPRPLGGSASKTVFKRLKPGRDRLRIAARNAIGTSPYSTWVKFRVRCPRCSGGKRTGGG